MTHLDGYVILTRIYHDVIVFDNRRVAIFACAGFGGAPMISDSYHFELSSKGILKRAIFEKGDVFTILAQGLVSGTDYNATSKVVASPDSVYAHVVAVGQAVSGPIQVIRVNKDGKLYVAAEVAVVDSSGESPVQLTEVNGVIA